MPTLLLVVVCTIFLAIAGSIALIQGGCNFIDKVRNAENAGAVGVIFLMRGKTVEEIVEEPLKFPILPVVGISFQSGEILVENSDSDVTLEVDAGIVTLETKNICRTPIGTKTVLYWLVGIWIRFKRVPV